MVENFTAHITPFGLDRNTFVYLPDDWQSSGRRYPVVYMFDGHNLFFDSTATYGTCWGLMQVHPINYDRLRGLGIEPTDYEGNIVAGVLLIGELLDKYGDQHKALMAYNCGEGGAAKLWQQGYYSSQYSRHVLNVSESWQQIIDDLKNI